MYIGIIGNGFCGNATGLFKCKEIKTILYDIAPQRCMPLNTQFIDLIECDIIFICINTPLNNKNEYNLTSIDKIIKDLNDLNFYNIVIRSTVTPEYCYSKQVTFFPEFLTENNWKIDFYNCSTWVIGLHNNNNNDIKNLMTLLIHIAYDNNCIKNKKIIFTTNTTAELCKIVRNSYLATKVSFFNEIYNICKLKNIDYNNELHDIILCDKRIGDSHTLVPNNNKFGFGGSCFPKDIIALAEYSKKIGNSSIILESVINRNENIDRPEQEWRDDPRSFRN
jgi:UDPglucose 6-dehydrogenase